MNMNSEESMADTTTTAKDVSSKSKSVTEDSMTTETTVSDDKAAEEGVDDVSENTEVSVVDDSVADSNIEEVECESATKPIQEPIAVEAPLVKRSANFLEISDHPKDNSNIESSVQVATYTDAANQGNEEAVKAGTDGVEKENSEQKTELMKDSNEVFVMRKTLWRDSVVSFMCQSKNGPCPLLALCNLLILRGDLKINPDAEVVTIEYLLTLLGELLMNTTPSDNRPEIMLNHEHNLGACFGILPKLQTGLDVNVRFIGIDQMEYTGDTIIFDLLRVDLLHGWLVDPSDTETCAAIGDASYNKLVELVVAYHEVTESGTTTSFENLKDNTTVQTGMTIANFLEATASQLTLYGIQQLRSRLRNGDLAIFFRNNHFSTISKHDDEIFVLVTDQGYCRTTIVWEMLNDVNGGGAMYDSEFKIFTPKPAPETDAASAIDAVGVNTPSTENEDLAEAMKLNLQESGTSATSAENEEEDKRALSTEESDHLLALSLSNQLSDEGVLTTKEQSEAADRQFALRLAEGLSPELAQHSEDSDRAMALKLQAEENDQASRSHSSTNSSHGQRPSQSQSNSTTTPRDKKSQDKDSSCCVS